LGSEVKKKSIESALPHQSNHLEDHHRKRTRVRDFVQSDVKILVKAITLAQLQQAWPDTAVVTVEEQAKGGNEIIAVSTPR
jgi:hypothetical protein